MHRFGNLFASLIIGIMAGHALPVNAATEDPASLDTNVMTTLKQCQAVAASCAEATQDAPGILVFPEVLKADLIIGGAGGKGALVENGVITGYYQIGAASAGLQAGIETNSQVYVFRTADALQQFKAGKEWKVGATLNVTVMEADASVRGAAGDVFAFIFDSKGVHAGMALDVFRVWKSDEERS